MIRLAIAAGALLLAYSLVAVTPGYVVLTITVATLLGVLAGIKGLPVLGPLWQRQKTRRMMIQLAIGAGALLFVRYLVVKAAGLDLGYAFLSGDGGFAFSHQWMTNYDTSSSMLDAYGVGILNTVRLVVIALVMTTVLGVFAGIARLSDNWLVSRMATVYVETIRNTPVLIQIVIWYSAVLLQLPRISEAVNFFDIAYLSNRALALPYVTTGNNFGPWLVIVLVGAVGAVVFGISRRRREDRIGGNQHALLWAFVLFATVAVVSFFITGRPLDPDTPSLKVSAVGLFRIEDGLQVSPEFAAVLLGLVIYTGAFIAEIVRSGIQALPRGQDEAATALGLSGYQRMSLIILPQALRIIIPPLTNQFLSLTKNSSLAVAIAYPEIIWVGGIIINNFGHAVPMFIMIFGTYLSMSLAISVVMNALNRRVQLAGN